MFETETCVRHVCNELNETRIPDSGPWMVEIHCKGHRKVLILQTHDSLKNPLRAPPVSTKPRGYFATQPHCHAASATLVAFVFLHISCKGIFDHTATQQESLTSSAKKAKFNEWEAAKACIIIWIGTKKAKKTAKSLDKMPPTEETGQYYTSVQISFCILQIYFCCILPPQNLSRI